MRNMHKWNMTKWPTIYFMVILSVRVTPLPRTTCKRAKPLPWGSSAVATLWRYLATAAEIATAKLPLVAPNLKIRFELVAWAAVNRKGHYNAPHVHPMATWSGVYYVDPGDEPEKGCGAVL